MKVANKKVLITGGTRGIGQALAQIFSQQGAKVMICGSSPESVQEALNHMAHIKAVCCDLGEAEDRRALANEINLHWGGLDILINCAGIQRSIHHQSMNPDFELTQEIEVNLVAPIQLTQLLLPLLVEAEEAAILNITSILATTPIPRSPVYCASKAGLSAWTTALRYQLKESSVRVFELIPPLVSTQMTSGRDTNAIAPEIVAERCLQGLLANQEIIRVGKAKVAYALHRLSPMMAGHILRKG